MKQFKIRIQSDIKYVHYVQYKEIYTGSNMSHNGTKERMLCAFPSKMEDNCPCGVLSDSVMYTDM